MSTPTPSPAKQEAIPVEKHTPGPWVYRPEQFDDWGVVRSGRNWICQAKDPRYISDEILASHRVAKTDPWEANARLIAAAPDMLEALKTASWLLADVSPDGLVKQKVDAAILKATQP